MLEIDERKCRKGKVWEVPIDAKLPHNFCTKLPSVFLFPNLVFAGFILVLHWNYLQLRLRYFEEKVKINQMLGNRDSGLPWVLLWWYCRIGGSLTPRLPLLSVEPGGLEAWDPTLRIWEKWGPTCFIWILILFTKVFQYIKLMPKN